MRMPANVGRAASKIFALALDPFEFALAPTVCSVGVAVDVASELFLRRLADVVPKTDVAFERREDIALAPSSPNRLLSFGRTELQRGEWFFMPGRTMHAQRLLWC